MATPTNIEVRDRENGTALYFYINGSGNPHIMATRGSETLHFEPSDAQLRRIRDGIVALLNRGP